MQEPQTASRFANRAKDYAAYRPSYAEAAIPHLAATFALPADAVIADIGCGTGILARQLLDALPGAPTVIGIEPNCEMREAGDEHLADHARAGRFTSRPGTAESTGLPDASVDLVVAAQAFHWFDVPRARAECMRILKNNGRAGVALLWNERRGLGANVGRLESDGDGAADPVMSAYDRLLVRHAIDYAQVDHHVKVDERLLGTFYGPRGFARTTFPNPARMTFEQLRGRLQSSSYTPAEGEPGHAEMLAELRLLFDRHQREGVVHFVYDTQVFSGRLSA